MVLFFYNLSFWSPIVRAHHLLSFLAQCSAWNSVLNGVGSKDFKVSRHQNFEVLGFLGFATYPNFKVLGFLGLAAYQNLEVLGIQGPAVNHNFDVLGFQSPTTKRTCKVQDPSRSQTLDSANPGSRVFLGPWHKSDNSLTTQISRVQCLVLIIVIMGVDPTTDTTDSVRTNLWTCSYNLHAC